MVAVSSEAIREIDYDAKAHALRVRFTDGDWYRYFEVPPRVAGDFLSAPSHGRFFQAHIRDRYPYWRER
ncbi:MAG: KTSC domain-containing protein [Proteobacteria bacterium]|nr:KTSC domain-containing protein [Pseudomonadota bacterium]